MGRFAQLIKQIARECVNLLFPRGCSGCDAPDEVLCERCSNRLRLCVPFTLQHSTSHTGFACAFYTGTVRQMVLNWKDHGDERRLLCWYLRRHLPNPCEDAAEVK